jgi:hypothetical protein
MYSTTVSITSALDRNWWPTPGRAVLLPEKTFATRFSVLGQTYARASFVPC